MKEEFKINRVVLSTQRSVRFMKELERSNPSLKERIKSKFKHIRDNITTNAALHDIADIKKIGGKRFYVFRIGSVEVIATIDFNEGVMFIVDIYKV